MTENEAIELLRSMQNPKQDYADVVCAPAFCTGFRFVYPEPEDYAIEEAIKALKQIQQYREIGTVEECREAVEKQKPKKRIYPKTALERYYHAPECPNCKRELKPRICGYTLSQAIEIYSYCPWCGQNLEGVEESEGEEKR